jgi:hypothetical protein
VSGAQLDLSCVIETAAGPLQLQDPESGYELAKESLASRSVNYRKIEVSGDFTEGTYTDRRVRGNVTESLSVYVAGESAYEFRQRVRRLTDALEQLAFTITMRVEDATETWRCTCADYSIDTTQEFMFATIGLVKATVPRLPAAALSRGF